MMSNHTITRKRIFMSDKLARARHTHSADLAASAASPQNQTSLHGADTRHGEPCFFPGRCRPRLHCRYRRVCGSYQHLHHHFPHNRFCPHLSPLAFALGSTLLSSSYQVANNLPNQLYELVCGGMIGCYRFAGIRFGEEEARAACGCWYASNLLTLVVLLGAVSLLCMLFPSAVIYTQSFYSDQSQMATSVFFFQFFAIQIVFYGCSAIVSGLLNASRDYLWSSIAPVANNLIVIVTFLAYSFVVPHDPELALYIIAIGNPASVFIQMAIQLPALKRSGIRIRPL